jgi:putative FmdB family regulatory protein
MPTYNFKCNECEQEFEVLCRISERNNQSCPGCQAQNYQPHFTTPVAMGDPVRLGVRTTDNGFKEVLSRIGKANPRSDLGAKLSRK